MKIVDEVIAPYEIWQDEKNFSVGIPKKQKDDSILLSNVSYFTSLSMCLVHIVKMKIANENKIVNLNQYIKDYLSVKEEILNKIEI